MLLRIAKHKMGGGVETQCECKSEFKFIRKCASIYIKNASTTMVTFTFLAGFVPGPVNVMNLLYVQFDPEGKQKILRGY